MCASSSGWIVTSLNNFDSSCVVSIKSSLEGGILMNAVFKVSEVVSVLTGISKQKVACHNVTDDCAIPPITVKNNAPFIINMTSYATEN